MLHGRSTAKAIKNALRVAADFSEKRVYEVIASKIEKGMVEKVDKN